MSHIQTFTAAWDDTIVSALARLVAQSPRTATAAKAARSTLRAARQTAALFAATTLFHMCKAEGGNLARAALLRTGGISQVCAFLAGSTELETGNPVRQMAANVVVITFSSHVILEALGQPRARGEKDQALEAMVLLCNLDNAASCCNPALVDVPASVGARKQACRDGLLGALMQQYWRVASAKSGIAWPASSRSSRH